MIRSFFLVLFTFTLFLQQLAVAKTVVHDPAHRLYLETDRKPLGVVVPGEKVRLLYTLYTPHFFSDAPFYQKPVVENALVMEQQIVSHNATLNGKRMAAQTIEIDIYPTEDGIFEVSDLRFMGKISSLADGDLPTVSLYSQPHVILVRTPPELQGRPGFVATKRLRISDQWQHLKQEHQAGDLVTRTVTIEAEQVPAMLLPDFIITPPHGVTVLLTEPSLQTVDTRFDHYSKLTQTVTYSFDKAGTYQLGGEEIRWWKLGKGVEHSFFDKKEIKVTGWAFSIWYLLWIVVALSGAFVLYWLWRRLDRKKYRLLYRLQGASPEEFVGLAYRWHSSYGRVNCLLRQFDPRIADLYQGIFARKRRKFVDWPRTRRALVRKLRKKREQ